MIADPNFVDPTASSSPPIKHNDNQPNGNGNGNGRIDMRSVINDSVHHKFILNEGQYNVQYSDSDCSNNDKHGASEVIMSALMPKNDTTSDDEQNDNDPSKMSEFDVDKLLDKMEDIFDSLTNDDDEHYDNDIGLIGDDSDDVSDGIFPLQRSQTVGITKSRYKLRPKFRGSVSSSSMDAALTDGSYSGPDEPILESINNTVLKMCGIRDSKDRKIIMYHIEALINGNSTTPATPNNNHNHNLNENKEKTPNDHNSLSSPMINIPEMEKSEDKVEYEEKERDTDVEMEEEVPSEFMCPITKQLMEDPVICSDGHSYERNAIEDWLVKHDKSPMTTETYKTSIS